MKYIVQLLLLQALLAFVNVNAIMDDLNYFNWEAHTDAVLENIKIANKKFDTSGDTSDLTLYDFIVVGAGSAGSTLVAKLTEKNKALKILLIEAGGHEYVEGVQDYRMAMSENYTDYFFKDFTEPLENLNNRRLLFRTGRGLGGSSLANYMIWAFGHQNDYDEWAHITQDNEWKYTRLLQLFREIETDGEHFDSNYRGDKGPVYVSEYFTKSKYSEKLLDAVCGLGFPKVRDYNGVSPYGANVMQLNIKPVGNMGMRQDAFWTQVRPHFGNPNLHILTKTFVDKVVLDGSKAVDYVVIKTGGEFYKVKAKYDVTLTAGALRTPLILMRSGVGDCDELKSLGIECVVDLPGVGKNLQNHPLTPVWWKFDQYDQLGPNENINLNLVWGEKKARFLTNATQPKFQIITYYIRDNPNTSRDRLGIYLFHPHTSSLGYVKLRTTDVEDAPLIFSNHLKTEEDLNEHFEGIRLILNIGKGLQNDFLGDIISPPSVNITDEELREWIRDNGDAGAHYSGTCKMGLKRDATAVVDSKLRVFGVSGLRVADNSIMPVITSLNTQVPAMLIGSNCAEMIFNEWFKKN